MNAVVAVGTPYFVRLILDNALADARVAFVTLVRHFGQPALYGMAGVEPRPHRTPPARWQTVPGIRNLFIGGTA
jgi:hypothetical protein